VCSVQREEGKAADMVGRDCDRAGMLAGARDTVRSSQQRVWTDGSKTAGRGRSVACRKAELRLAGGMAESGLEHRDVGRLKNTCLLRAAERALRGRRKAQPSDCGVALPLHSSEVRNVL